MSLHRCTEAECPFVGQTTNRSCRCHRTDEQVQGERIASLVEALEALCDDIDEHHAPDDCGTCRLVDKARAALAKAEAEGRP